MRIERGFTLVEVMVALAITAALLSAVYSSLWVGVVSTARISSTIADNDSERTITHFIRNQLRHVETRGFDDSAPFAGGQLSMRFQVRYLRGDPALRTFDIGLARDAIKGMVLRIAESGAEGQVLPISEVLMENLESIKFEYFGVGDDAPQATWYGTWESADRLPQLVRVKYRQYGKLERELYLAVAGAMENRPASTE